MEELAIEDDSLTRLIIEAIIHVHKVLGPGFLENIYRNALLIELKNKVLSVESEKEVNIYYKNELIGKHRLDLIVDNSIIIELKTVENLNKLHYSQIRSYLKATNCRIGLLVNFAKERADFRRIEIE